MSCTCKVVSRSAQQQTIRVINAIQNQQCYGKCSVAMQMFIIDVQIHVVIVIKEAWSDTNVGAYSKNFAGIPRNC